MKIYDISREVFSSKVYPGDPKPKIELLQRLDLGDNYNLSAFYMNSHTATHVDAPSHFIEGAKMWMSLSYRYFLASVLL